jgi:lysophospholipase L1-like esterase
MMKRFVLIPLLFLAGVVGAETVKSVATTPVERPEERNQQRHTKFNEVSKEGTAEVVFLGDSITQGWEGKGKAMWEQHFAPMKAANFGIGGDRTEHVLWRLANGNLDGLKPKLVVLMIGTNNTGHQGREGYVCTAQQTADGVKEILAVLEKKCPQAKVLLLGIFPRGPDAMDKFRVQNAETNAIIKGYADGKRVFWKDLGSVFLEKDGTLSKEIMPDLLHLNEKGYQMWAEAILPDVVAIMK